MIIVGHVTLYRSLCRSEPKCARFVNFFVKVLKLQQGIPVCRCPGWVQSYLYSLMISLEDYLKVCLFPSWSLDESPLQLCLSVIAWSIRWKHKGFRSRSFCFGDAFEGEFNSSVWLASLSGLCWHSFEVLSEWWGVPRLNRCSRQILKGPRMNVWIISASDNQRDCWIRFVFLWTLFSMNKLGFFTFFDVLYEGRA